jgi:hypothetical protein
LQESYALSADSVGALARSPESDPGHLDRFQDRLDLREIAPLTSRDHDRQRLPALLDREVDLRLQRVFCTSALFSIRRSEESRFATASAPKADGVPRDGVADQLVGAFGVFVSAGALSGSSG